MRTLLNLTGRRVLPTIRQSEAAECGLACMAMVCAYHGYDVDLLTLRRRFSTSIKGMSLRTIIDIATAVGFSARAIRCEVAEICDLRLPAILHWGTNHFVVVEKAGPRGLIIHDPAIGRVKISRSAASRSFTGIALELTPNAAFKRVRSQNPLKLSSIVSFGGGVTRAGLQAVFLSIIIEAMSLASPFYLQFIIDEGILRHDNDIINVLAICFTSLLLIRVFSALLRGLTTQFMSSLISLDVKAKVFNHLIRLPLEWSQRRHIGDIQSKFWAIKSIQTFVSQGALTGILDGLLGAFVFVMLLAYSTTLAFITLVSLLLYVFIRIMSYKLSKRYAADSIITDAKEQTRLLESIRAIQTIKSSGAEGIRDGQYQNSSVASVNSQIRSGNITLIYMASEQAINGITDILVVYLGARSVIAGDLTLGMLTAFLAYKGQFVNRLTNFIEQMIAWNLLDLQLERIADIALSDKEIRIDQGGIGGQIRGALELRCVSYRYAYGESFVLDNISIRIVPGECVAIIGESGCGKSTLAKLMMGLYEPTVGEVYIDGRSLSVWNKRVLRSQISYVSQDDQLLAGSIAENIAGFVDNIDLTLVQHCAQLAYISNEIEAMPMGYESLVGDMGSSLSGGQKQRIMIARALYRRPSILILDEATAHLDIDNEKAIAESLRDLSITRVLIAHRPETVNSADRIITLGQRRRT